MTTDEKYMARCLELAGSGLGHTAPNPLVGAVIVYNGKIIGEGYHKKYGGPHAEVNAVNSVCDPQLLKQSTIYVNLEPCSHQGKTPPCSDMIIREGIPKVVIGTRDSFPEVAGRGIARLKEAGKEVITGILEKDCRELNIRFFTFHEKKRPYIILKWAQTADGFVDRFRVPEESGKPTWITGTEARKLVHRYRSEEAAIMVGTKTVIRDNPALTTRDWPGKNPVRVVIDRNLALSGSFQVFNSEAPTIIFNQVEDRQAGNLKYIRIDFSKTIIPQMLDILYQQNLQSLIVEGGPFLLSAFINSNLWDEARVFYGKVSFEKGIKAPEFAFLPDTETEIADDILKIYRRHPNN